MRLRVDDRSRHDLQQMHGLIPSADSNGDKWTSRRATEGVAHLYSSKIPQNLCLYRVYVFMSIPAAAAAGCSVTNPQQHHDV